MDDVHYDYDYKSHDLLLQVHHRMNFWLT